MIYLFKFNGSKKDDFTNTEFTLTADTKSQLYTRIMSQYGVTKDKVLILKELNEDNLDNGGLTNGKKKDKLHHRRTKK